MTMIALKDEEISVLYHLVTSEIVNAPGDLEYQQMLEDLKTKLETFKAQRKTVNQDVILEDGYKEAVRREQIEGSGYS
jgi:hypothetical protein